MWIVNQSSPDFSWNAGGIAVIVRFPILDILTLSGDIRDQTRKLSEIAPNFACFWPPISLGAGAPDRPRELGGSPAKGKKNITGKT